MTFSVAKPVHLLPPPSRRCGALNVVDIGIEGAEDPVRASFDHDDLAARWPAPTASDDK